VTGKSLYINNDISAGFLNASFREKKKKRERNGKAGEHLAFFLAAEECG
jgi:hypothetical protein